MVRGFNIWDAEWESLGPDFIEAFEPTRGEIFRLRCFQVRLPDRIVIFAAGETSANVWLFGVEG